MIAPATNSTPPELLVEEEAIIYLRLDTDNRNPKERLRNLVRRQGLPILRRGRLVLFRRSELDLWLNGERVKRHSKGGSP